MKQRVLSAIIMVAIVLVCMLISVYTRIAFFLAVAILCIRELVHVYSLEDVHCTKLPLYFFPIAWSILLVLDVHMEIHPAYYLAAGFFAIVWIFAAAIANHTIYGRGAEASLSILVYPLFLLLLIAAIGITEHWYSVMILACLATWTCDSFAMFGGKWFGKHKLAPYTSPNKTVEGTICGAISSLLAGLASYFLLRWLGHSVALWICLLASLICSSVGQYGDLAASLFKRMVGIKDYSNLIPGHGGMMDRADSLLFSIPTAYLCLTIFGLA